MIGGDQGSTTPLIIGFFILALLVTGGSIAAGQAFIQQVNLQDACDGAATAAVAAGVDTDRGIYIAVNRPAQLMNLQLGVDEYLKQVGLAGYVEAMANLSDDSRMLELKCTMTSPVAFGTIIGERAGVTHTARSSAEAISP